MKLSYKFTETELKRLVSDHMVIICDTREQENRHILGYFDKHKVKYETKKLDAGDYSVVLKAYPEIGLMRDLHLPVMIEKKNSVDELAQSFKDRTRFESEFIRAKGAGTKIHMLVEDGEGYENMIKGNYRSQYDPKALLASLKTFESRYGFTTVFQKKAYAGHYIYYTLRYFLYECLKS